MNFVDSNNLVLGYDLKQDCCEYAHWRISTSEKDYNKTNTLYNRENVKELELENYCFDPNYYAIDDKCAEDGSEGGSAIFKLVGAEGLNLPDLFVILSNDSGHYSHGFMFTKMLESGEIESIQNDHI